jgi:streptogramin lyase
MSHVEMRYARRAVVVCLVVVVFVFGAVAAASPTPVARIVTGIGPCGLHSAFGSVWVAGYGTGRLVRIDPQRNRVVRRTKIARGICHVASGPGFLWVASDVTDVVYRVAWRSGRVVGRTAVGRWPADLEVAFGSMWVSAYEVGTVARLDLRTGRVLRVYRVGGNPSGLARFGDALWISFGRSGRALGRLDPASGAITRIPIGHDAPGALVRAFGSLWTTTADGYAVRVDPVAARVVAAVAVPGTPAGIAAAPDGTLWVAEKERDTVTRIDPAANRVLDVTHGGRCAFSVVVAAGDVWISSFAGSDVWRFRP